MKNKLKSIKTCISFDELLEEKDLLSMSLDEFNYYYLKFKTNIFVIVF